MPLSTSWSIAILDKGLVCGAGSVLARMVGPGDRPTGLALTTDRDRLLAMLSVAAGRPVPAAEVLHHIEAASAHWRNGDKAVANLRLIFARLPSPTDCAAVDRLARAEVLLDEGLPPARLMKALWPKRLADELRRYNRNEPRVPAGNGVESGRWTFAGDDTENASFEDAYIVVAANPGGTKGETGAERVEEEKLFEEQDRLGLATPEEEFEHGRPIDPLSGMALGRGRDAVESAAKSAATAVGPGRGPVYGTAVHTELRNQIRSLKDPNLFTEQSYLNGKRVDYGTKGSVRLDAGDGHPDNPTAGYDLKTGAATLTDKRIGEIRQHLPEGHQDIPIFEVRP